MIDEIAAIRNQYGKDIKAIEERIEEAAINTEIQYLAEFCKDSETRIKKTQEQIEAERTKLRKYMADVVQRKAATDRLDYANRLAVIIFLLEEHLETKKNMEKELAILSRMGERNELVKAVAESLASRPELKEGLDDTEMIHAEFKKSIARAKLGAFVDHNAGFAKYCMNFLVYLLFKNFHFSPALAEYVGKDESRLLKNVRHVDYLATYMKQHNYDRAMQEIAYLDVCTDIEKVRRDSQERR